MPCEIGSSAITDAWGGDIVNNDAKDVIGRLRAINVLLLLLRIETPVFPLDNVIRSLLVEYRPRFLRMIGLVSELAHFGDLRSELLSCADDILDPASSTYYTQDYLDMLLSLYRGREHVLHLNYEDVASVRAVFIETCLLDVTELIQSVLWLRIGFETCYPDGPLLPLREGWPAFCELVCAIGGKPLGVSCHSLIASSLRSWRLSETVVAAREKVETTDMPHKAAFLKSVAEVEAMLEGIDRMKD
jgi:hypothetical protein